MRKTVKVLVAVFMLGLVASLTSCMEMAEAVVGSMTQAAFMYDVTYNAKTASGKKVEFKFNNSNLSGRFKLNVWVNGKAVDNDGYTWMLEGVYQDGKKTDIDNVIIYQVTPSENDSDTKIATLKADSAAPTSLTVEETFKVGSETISKGTVFNR